MVEEIGWVEGGGVWVSGELVMDGGELELRGEGFDDGSSAEGAAADDRVGGFGEEDEGSAHQEMAGRPCGCGARTEASFSM